MTSLERFSPLLFLLMWSSGAIFVKLGLEYASVSVFLAIRSMGAAIALFLMMKLISKTGGVSRKLSIDLKLLLKIFGLGLVLQVAYQAAYFMALNSRTTPGVLSIILGLQPILTPTLAREKVGTRGFLFLLLGFIGLAIAVLGAREIGAITPAGLLFGLLAVLAISLGSVFQKKIKINPMTSAFYQSIVAAIIFVAAMAVTPIRLALTPQFALSAAWMILVVSTFAVLLLFYMLERNSASKVGALFYMVPVITIVFDYAIFGNRISTITLIGAVVILISLKGFNWSQRDALQSMPLPATTEINTEKKQG